MLGELIVVGMVLIGQIDQATVPPSAPSDLEIKVRSLLRQLDDEFELAPRIEAEKELIRLGPGILDLLPEVTRSTSADVVLRLGRIRNALEKAAAATATQSSLVTLQGSMSLAEALAALEKQTGNRVVGYENRGGSVNVTFESTPYWEALDNILDQVGMSINQYGGYAGAISVVSRPDSTLPRSGRSFHNGIFRFEAVQLSAVRDLRDPTVNAARLTLEVGWEPRTLPISLAVQTDQIEAKDEKGNTIAVDTNQVQLEPIMQREISMVEFVMPFQLPDRGVKQIALLKGNMMAMIPGRTETFEFAQLEKSKDVQQRRAGATVTYEQLRKNLELYEVRMRLRFDQAANALESHRGWVYNNEAYLIDASGNKVMPATLETTRQEPDEVGIAYLFDLAEGPEDYRFIYKTPAAIIKMPVEFELKDIALP